MDLERNVDSRVWVLKFCEPTRLLAASDLLKKENKEQGKVMHMER